MFSIKLTLTSLAAAALLAACGGGHPRDPGSLMETPTVLTTLTRAQLDASPLVALSGKAKCDVKVVNLNHVSSGPKGEVATVSGVLLLPSGENCTAAAPLVAYAKGTDLQKSRTLANPADSETGLLAAMYAGQGYAVVATDHLGYARSDFSYHPYLHADSEASSVINSIRAARAASKQLGASLSGKVMLTGYSQGGHASMAAQRAIEKNLSSEIQVVAGAHLAGPYNLSGMVRLPEAIAGYQFFVPFLISSWQKVYGNLYSDVKSAFKAPYSGWIENLLPSSTLNATTLVTTGPTAGQFWLPGALGQTPNQARDELFQPAFLADLANSNNAVVQAARLNDLLDWTPLARVLLCGGSGDPTVPPAVHQNVLKATWDAKGVSNFSSVDVDPYISATYGPVTAANAASYYGSYHGTYEPPFCHAQARALFDALK
jgi:pimeloyl-ACP methyl ester carboxylesterase